MRSEWRSVGRSKKKKKKSPLDCCAFGPDVRPSELDEIVNEDWPRSWNTKRKRQALVITTRRNMLLSRCRRWDEV